MSSEVAPVIEMRGITKKFPGVVANVGIDLALYPGQVHALLGENGAGKTTLMNILYGLYSADSGEIRVRGKLVSMKSPKISIALGIAMVHQQFELVPTLTVAENVGLGLRSKTEPVFDSAGVSRRILELSKAHALKVEPSMRVEQLSVGEKQRVEVIKALYRGAEILILDEPTSVLTPQEAEELFRFVRSMATEGRVVVLITHKLAEVMAVSDRVTVLRRGKVVARLETKRTNPEELAEMMVGRVVSHDVRPVGRPAGGALLELRNVWATNDREVPALKDVSLTLNEGEILGIAGVAGNGQTELAEVLSGMRRVNRGNVLMEGEDLTNAKPSEVIERGIGYIPEDRAGSALVMDFTISENLVLEVRNKPPYTKRLILNQTEMREHARMVVEEFSITCTGVDAPARTLSGGNVQKLVLAKVLSRSPKILVAAQPTAGLDVGAAQFISKKLTEQKDKGVGVFLISGDLGEVTSLSDRIACIFEGRIMGIVPGSNADAKELGMMMGGVARN